MCKLWEYICVIHQEITARWTHTEYRSQIDLLFFSPAQPVFSRGHRYSTTTKSPPINCLIHVLWWYKKNQFDNSYIQCMLTKYDTYTCTCIQCLI